MTTSTYDNTQNVNDGEGPFYTSDSSKPPYAVAQVANSLAQGAGSSLDADTIVGIQAVTAKVAGPNKLVATDKNGKLPIGIMPLTGGGSGVIGYVTGTAAGLTATPPTGLSFAIFTDIGPAGALMFYFNDPTVGNNGWILLGGS